MAEKKVIEIDVTEQGLNDITNKTKSLKAQLKEAIAEVQNMSAEFGETSEQVAQAAKRAAELKDRIEDANDAVLAFKGEGAFIATGKAISSVASGFSAVEGAMGLMGVESEKLQETLLRVQSAMALAQGLEGLEDAGRSFKQLKVVAIDAFKGIKGAMLASGIGALVVTLGVIYSYWDDIKYAMSGVSAEQDDLNAKAQANVDMQKSKLESIGGQENILRLQGKSEKDILNLKIAQTDQVIQATEAQIKQNEITLKAQIEATKKNKEILKGIIDFVAAPLILLLKGIDKVAAAFGKNLKLAEGFKEMSANLIFDPKEVEQEGKAAIAEQKKALTELKNQQAGNKLALKELNKTAAKEAQSASDEQKKKEADELAELQRAQLEATKTQSELEIIDITAKYDQLIALAKKHGKETKDFESKKSEEILAIKTKQKEDEQKIVDDANQKRIELEDKQFELEQELTQTAQEKEISDLVKQYEAKFELANGNAELEKQLTEQQKKDIADIEEKYRKEKQEKDDAAALEAKQKQQSIQNFWIDQAAETFNILGDLAQTFAGKSEKAQRKAFNIQKAASIATTLLETYKAAQSAYASQVIPGDPSSLIRGGVAAGIATAAGLARVAKIAKTQFNSSNAGGGGDTPNGSLPENTQQAPNFNIVGNAGSNPLAQLGNAPLQAYVVSGEVTSAQSLDRNRIVNATL